MPTKIEWAQESWNPVTGCTKISPGCKNCYACRMSKRLAGRAGYPADAPFRVTLHPERLDQPLRWRKPRRVFVCSMGDLFHEDVPFEFIDKVLRIAALRPKHTFIILTKRPERMKRYFCDIANNAPGMIDRILKVNSAGLGAMQKEILRLRRGEYFSNLWLGVTTENQEQADKRIPILLKIPAAVRFVSVEPMLGPVDLDIFTGNTFDDPEPSGLQIMERWLHKLNWVICGGESGPGARPMHPDWPRKVRDDCVAAGVPFLFKQWGEYVWRSTRGHSTGRPKYYFPDNVWVEKVGKKAAGRELDGKIWNEFPGRI